MSPECALHTGVHAGVSAVQFVLARREQQYSQQYMPPAHSTVLTHPSGPDVLTVCLITSKGPLNVVFLSCSLILTSSNGVTTTDSVAPAKQPVAIARVWVFFF